MKNALNKLLDLIFPYRVEIRHLKEYVKSLTIEQNRINDALRKINPNSGAPRVTKEERILEYLNNPRTTVETAKYLGESRTWASLQLNKLLKNDKIKQVSRTTQGIYYKRVTELPPPARGKELE